jgi:hypothetical protein
MRRGEEKRGEERRGLGKFVQVMALSQLEFK